jgi:flagellar basal body rod protein FlgC
MDIRRLRVGFLLCLLACLGCPPAPEAPLPVCSVRRTPETPKDLGGAARLEILLEALAYRPSVQGLPDEKGAWSILVSEPKLSRSEGEGLDRLGVKSAGGTPGGPRRRVLAPAEQPAFAAAVRKARAETLLQLSADWRALDHALSPGVLTAAPEGGGVFLPGRLVYTGHPLDLAAPDGGHKALTFFVVNLERPSAGLVPSIRVLCRGGRAHVGADGFLRLPCGMLTDLNPAPRESEEVRIDGDGTVIVQLRNRERRTLGRLAVVMVPEDNLLQGDGEVFAVPTSAVSVTPGEGTVPYLPVGHLEVSSPPAGRAAALAEKARLLALLNALESVCQAAPFAVNRTLEIADPLSLSVEHMKALRIPFESGAGRITLQTGGNPEEAQRILKDLAEVLRGLRRRMEIAQENFNHACRVRDDTGALNPYRRKVIEIGKAGEVLEARDLSPFPKRSVPDSKDAGPDGLVAFPNVNRQIERADFHRAREEYLLLRAALGRLNPDHLHPEPPEFQGETKP